MGELLFIGLGLHDERGLSLRGLDEVKRCDRVFAEFYTSHMPGFSIERLSSLVGKRVEVQSRGDLEERPDHVLSSAKHGKVALLVPGDPMTATTHVDLRLRAEHAGIKTRIIHSASIASAVAGVTGLQLYKFGRTVTVPLPETVRFPDSTYSFIKANSSLGLHTLALLDMRAEEQVFLTIPEALARLLRVEENRGQGIVTEKTLAVGVARVEAPDMRVHADTVRNLLDLEFGGPPHSIVFPGKLHFMEADALEVLAGARREILEANL